MSVHVSDAKKEMYTDMAILWERSNRQAKRWLVCLWRDLEIYHEPEAKATHRGFLRNNCPPILVALCSFLCLLALPSWWRWKKELRCSIFCAPPGNDNVASIVHIPMRVYIYEAWIIAS